MHAVDVVPLDHGHVALADPVPLGQHLLNLMRISDRGHLGVSEFSGPAQPVCHLPHVLALGPRGEVRWIDARGIIARVQNAQVVRYWAMMDLEREYMGAPVLLLVVLEAAVSVGDPSPSPFPALTWASFFNLDPKSLLKCRGSDGQGIAGLIEPLVVTATEASRVGSFRASVDAAFEPDIAGREIGESTLSSQGVVMPAAQLATIENADAVRYRASLHINNYSGSDIKYAAGEVN